MTADMNELLQSHAGANAGPVECLGTTFPSEAARREHFLNLLAEKLKDPGFRAQEGFPSGTDAAILAMSDPPYCTACPNPWLTDFVTNCGRPYDHSKEYRREPMAIDVSIGKSDPVYKAHSYHTSLPVSARLVSSWAVRSVTRPVSSVTFDAASTEPVW